VRFCAHQQQEAADEDRELEKLKVCEISLLPAAAAFQLS